MIKPFLVLQLRPEDAAADGELESFIKFGKIDPSAVHRVRMEKEDIPEVNLGDYSAIIIGGGPYNVSDKEKKPEQIIFESQLYSLLDKVVDSDFPFLGECYGLGILAAYLGGDVSKNHYSEPVSAVTIKLSKEALGDPILDNLPRSFKAFGGHKEACQNLPPTAIHLASSDSCPIQMIRVKQNIYATQFHPELDNNALVARAEVYKHAGYFRPEELDDLRAQIMKEEVTVPEEILKRFVTRYGKQ